MLRSSRLTAVSPDDIPSVRLAELFAPNVVRWLRPGFQNKLTEIGQRAYLSDLQQQAGVIYSWRANS
ncbi:hypothetical protein [Phaeobacter sp. C3_T13_0]|uniref:hypothetical protein n=1 Tax=Phaeobacter cretensis TaxID=3342641 RepID=UPI0039BCCF93